MLIPRYFFYSFWHISELRPPDIGYKVNISEYNENEEIVKEEVFYYYKSTGEYKIYETIIRNYNNNFNLEEETITRYSDSEKPFIYWQKKYLYNDNDFFLEWAVKRYSELTNQLENSSLYKVERDDANRIKVREELSVWNTDRNDWSFGYRYDYDFNDDGQQTLIKQSSRKLSDEDNYYWADKKKYETKYNEYGEKTEVIESYYKPDLESWVVASEVFNTYVNDTVLDNSVSYFYSDSEPFELLETSTLDYFYNDEGNLNEQISYSVINEEETLVGKYIYEYDLDGVQIKDCYYSWDAELDTFVKIRRIETIIDDNYRIEGIFMPYDMVFTFWRSTFKADGVFRLQGYSSDIIYKYHYSEYDGPQLSTPITTTPEISLYPNPTSDFITMDSKGTISSSVILHLYDVNGKLVYNEKITRNQKIEVNHLPPGTYIYNVFLKDEIKSGKVVIQL